MMSGSRNVITMAGYRMTYAQARYWLANAGIDPSPYNNSRPNMLDCLVYLFEEKKCYPDEIAINLFDDPITLTRLYILTCIVVRNLKRTE